MAWSSYFHLGNGQADAFPLPWSPVIDTIWLRTAFKYKGQPGRPSTRESSRDSFSNRLNKTKRELVASAHHLITLLEKRLVNYNISYGTWNIWQRRNIYHQTAHHKCRYSLSHFSFGRVKIRFDLEQIGRKGFSAILASIRCTERHTNNWGISNIVKNYFASTNAKFLFTVVTFGFKASFPWSDYWFR